MIKCELTDAQRQFYNDNFLKCSKQFKQSSKLFFVHSVEGINTKNLVNGLLRGTTFCWGSTKTDWLGFWSPCYIIIMAINCRSCRTAFVYGQFGKIISLSLTSLLCSPFLCRSHSSSRQFFTIMWGGRMQPTQKRRQSRLVADRVTRTIEPVNDGQTTTIIGLKNWRFQRKAFVRANRPSVFLFASTIQGPTVVSHYFADAPLQFL